MLTSPPITQFTTLHVCVEQKFVHNKQHNYSKLQTYFCIAFFSKIFEKVIYDKLLGSINANNTLYEKQFGFRQGHATSHAIMTLVAKVTKALDTGKIVVGVYLDIRKTFDSISTSIVLDKLYSIQFNSIVYFRQESIHMYIIILYKIKYNVYLPLNTDKKST